MRSFDLSLEELKCYRGINPRPADFDDYWERALAEMRRQDSRVERVPAEFTCSFADCFHLYFTGVGGARIHAKLLHPRRAAAPHPAVLKFHGYTGDSGDWMDLLGYAAQGYTVAALDCRGQGGLSEDPGGIRGNTHRGHIIRGLDDEPEKLLFRQIFLDTVQLAGIVMDMEEVDPRRVGATGGSQGGGLTLACAALEPRIRKAAAMFPFLCDYRRVWELDLGEQAYEELTLYFRRFDPTHEREGAIFERLGYIDCQHLAPRIRADVLMLTALLDQTCPPSTQFAAYNRITSAKRVVVYPDFRHEDLPGAKDRIFQFLTGL
jgi:cephalosporin-C deacetylase